MEKEVKEAFEAMSYMQPSDWGYNPGSIGYERAEYFCKQSRVIVAEIVKLNKELEDYREELRRLQPPRLSRTEQRDIFRKCKGVVP
jgi:hypothetical protein